MLEGLEIDESKFGGIYLDTRNRNQEMYILPEREAMILASGYLLGRVSHHTHCPQKQSKVNTHIMSQMRDKDAQNGRYGLIVVI